MGEQKRKKPLRERIKDRIRDLADELVRALDGLLQPAPQRVRIPVRR